MLDIRVIMHDQGPWRHKEGPHRYHATRAGGGRITLTKDIYALTSIITLYFKFGNKYKNKEPSPIDED